MKACLRFSVVYQFIFGVLVFLLSYLWLFYFTISVCIAQKPDLFSQVRFSAHGGYIYVHVPKLDSLGGYSRMVQGDIFLNLHGGKGWHGHYRYLQAGYSVLAGQTGSRHLGRFVSIIAFLEPRVFRKGRFWFSLRGSVGLAYLDKPYHAITNPANQLIGTHINATLQAMATLGFAVNKHIGIGILGTFTHFSNGALQSPNKGINIPTMGFMAQYRWAASATYTSTVPAFSKRWQLHINPGAGIKQLGNFPIEPQFFVWSANAYAHRRISYSSALQAGVSFFDDGALKNQLKIIQRNDKRLLDVKDHHMVGIFAGYELAISDFSILVQLGYYVYDPVKFYEKIFQRYGLKWYVNKKVFCGANLKAHFGAADFVEWNIGYVIGK